MTLRNKSKMRKNFGICESDLHDIKCFLQGAVYCWAKNKKDEIFAARDLMGGENYEWSGTPLICLYNKHINKGKSDELAIEEAGKDLGWILKSVLDEDKRTFVASDKGMTQGYKWVGNEA
ncbi:MAG: hypothetical protein U9N86_10060 [Bacteroidota bacterium]|nr:hypothetical protein [Bacteroidota bacterium]